MSFLSHIEASVRAGSSVSIEKKHWQILGLRIGGFLSYPHEEQLVRWAKAQGWEVMDDVAERVWVIGQSS